MKIMSFLKEILFLSVVMNLTSGDSRGAVEPGTSPEPSITVCRHLGVRGRREGDVALCCCAVEPGTARPAAVLPSQCG